jgi:hypothetical protein
VKALRSNPSTAKIKKMNYRIYLMGKESFYICFCRFFTTVTKYLGLEALQNKEVYLVMEIQGLGTIISSTLVRSL